MSLSYQTHKVNINLTEKHTFCEQQNLAKKKKKKLGGCWLQKKHQYTIKTCSYFNGLEMLISAF